MKNLLAFLLITVSFVFSVSSLYSQEIEYHGADSVFEAEGLAVFWAILKGTDINSSKVYIDIVPLDSMKNAYTSYRVVAANVFTGDEESVVELESLKQENLIIQEYGSFSKLAKRRLLFYRSEDTKDAPFMEIYYIGVPDTSPEFQKLEQINDFFTHSLNLVLHRTSK